MEKKDLRIVYMGTPDFAVEKDNYTSALLLVSQITSFVMSNHGIRRIILYRSLFKPTFAR